MTDTEVLNSVREWVRDMTWIDEVNPRSRTLVPERQTVIYCPGHFYRVLELLGIKR